MRRLWLLAAPAVLLTACQTFSAFHTARPIEKGTTEVAFAGVAQASTEYELEAVSPTFRVRRGLFHRVDIGINALFLSTDLEDRGRPLLGVGGAVDVNVLVLDLGLLKASVDPTISGSYAPASGQFVGTLHLNFLVDLVSTRFFTLVTGVRPGVVVFYADRTLGVTRGTELVAGGLVGLKLSVLGLSLMPELDVTFREGYDRPLYALGVALMF